MPSLNNLSENIPAFRNRISETKKALEPQPFPWYAYDILSNVDFATRLLHQANLTLPDLLGNRPVLDIGCADGDLAFFLESLGCSVTAVDYPNTNANGMRAIRALRTALNSSVEIIEADIDQGFVPPQGANYSLVILLGILYHLKNPFLVLESLSNYANYCLLSTRVARFSAAAGTAPPTALDELPVAYLLDPGEANNDITNYWIFSNTGLKRLIRRTGWEILAYFNVGNTEASDPVTGAGDERAFCLLARTDIFSNGKLLDGWYPPTGARDGWRWTADSFALEFPPTPPGRPVELELQAYLGEAQVAVNGSVTLSASVNGAALSPHVFRAPGSHLVRLPIPIDSVNGQILKLKFHVTPAAPGGLDPRPLGLVISSIRLRSVYERPTL